MPAVFSLLVLRFLPAVIGATYAFTSWNGVGVAADWSGLENFRAIFDDPITSKALFNTFRLAGLLVVIANVGRAAARAQSPQALKTRNLLRALFFLPVRAEPPRHRVHLAVHLPVRRPAQPAPADGGSRVMAAGLARRSAIGRSTPSLVVLVWQYTGLTMIIYLAGLEGIPDELHDAVAVDGASAWLKFRRVTLAAAGAGDHDQRDADADLRASGRSIRCLPLTGGGPVNATETLATQVWQQHVHLRALRLRLGAGADPRPAWSRRSRSRRSRCCDTGRSSSMSGRYTAEHSPGRSRMLVLAVVFCLPLYHPVLGLAEGSPRTCSPIALAFPTDPHFDNFSHGVGIEHRTRWRAADRAGQQPHHHRRRGDGADRDRLALRVRDRAPARQAQQRRSTCSSCSGSSCRSSSGSCRCS